MNSEHTITELKERYNILDKARECEQDIVETLFKRNDEYEKCFDSINTKIKKLRNVEKQTNKTLDQY